MKVYVITSGEYSDYHIVAVETDYEVAKRIVAQLNTEGKQWENRIEEHETGKYEIYGNTAVKRLYRMEVDFKSGEIIYFSEPYIVAHEENDIEISKEVLYGKTVHIHITATFPVSYEKSKVKKIMLDRIAKFKAEKMGI